MGELQLSVSLVSIATKINSHKNNIGYSFIEIGKELIRAKDEDLTHGEWRLFLDEINMSKSQADRHIKISTEYDLGKLPHVGNIGFRALYEIATMPEEERDKEHTLSSGKTKTPDEMTVRELQEVKRTLKEIERDLVETEMKAEQLESEKDNLSRQLESERNKQPEVKEVVKEVVPDDYDRLKGGYSTLEKSVEFYKNQNEELREEMQELEKMILEKEDPTNIQEVEELEKRKAELVNELSSTKRIIDFLSKSNDLIDLMSPIKYSDELSDIGDNYELLSAFSSAVENIERWCSEIRERLPDENIIEGVYGDAR